MGLFRELCRIRYWLELTKLWYSAENGVVPELGQSSGIMFTGRGRGESFGTEQRRMAKALGEDVASSLPA